MNNQERNESLNKLNVLLISDDQEDYEELKRCGINNISYFKSIIRADNYFRLNPDELKKYNIIINGSHKVQQCCFNGSVDLDKKINELKRKVLVLHLNKNEIYGQVEYETYLHDWEKFKDYRLHSHSLKTVYEEIIRHALTYYANTINRDEEFIPIKDYINPNRLSLPSKKRELKILYLDNFSVNRYAKIIANELGLDITFKEDDNTTLGKYVKSSLGDYDIIIVSDSHSRSILDMNYESTEQCKDTGRELTLLITYDIDSIDLIDEDNNRNNNTGSSIELNYVFGGNQAPDYEKHKIKYRVLRKPKDYVPEGCFKSYDENDIAAIKGTIEGAINIYNEALLQKKGATLEDLNSPSIEDLDKEYENFYDKEIQRKYAALEPIRNFDQMIYTITNYIYYLKHGFIEEEPLGLKVTEKKKSYQIDNIENGHIVGSITVPKNYKEDNLRIFKIRTLKDGNLGKANIVGLYTRKYQNLKNIQNRPDESQMEVLSDILEKIHTIISPLCNEAWDKENLIPKQKRI